MNNNKSVTVIRLALMCLAIMQIQVIVAQNKRQETIHGAPTRLSTPNDWTALQGLSEVQKAEVLLTWLIEERRKPTETFPGKGGGPIDSNYQQAQIVHALANSDPRILRWLLQSKTVKSTRMRDLVGLSAGIGGDLKAKSHMIKLLQTHQNPYVRELSARFLHEWQESDVVTALEKSAATDPFRVRFLSTDLEKGFIDGFPVRDAALNSIKNIQEGKKPNDYSRLWQARYKDRVKGYDEFVKEHKADLERIAKLINTDKPAKKR